jgi:hypothetical protein
MPLLQGEGSNRTGYRNVTQRNGTFFCRLRTNRFLFRVGRGLTTPEQAAHAFNELRTRVLDAGLSCASAPIDVPPISSRERELVLQQVQEALEAKLGGGSSGGGGGGGGSAGAHPVGSGRKRGRDLGAGKRDGYDNDGYSDSDSSDDGGNGDALADSAGVGMGDEGGTSDDGNEWRGADSGEEEEEEEEEEGAVKQVCQRFALQSAPRLYDCHCAIPVATHVRVPRSHSAKPAELQGVPKHKIGLGGG